MTEIFYFLTMFLYPKSFELCPKIVLQLEYMVLAAIYIIIHDITVFVVINVSLVYKIIYKHALFSILLFKC